MTLRKTTVENSVRYVPKNEETKDKNVNPKTIKAGSLPRRQNENPSQNIKRFLKNISASGFTTLTN